MKEFFKSAFAKNSYMNDYIYNFLTYPKVKEATEIIMDLEDRDYFLDLDVEYLKKFQSLIVSNQKVYWTSNPNWDNFHWYGIWEALFGAFVNSNNKLVSPAIEHGLFFHNDVFRDTTDTARMSCATLSLFRKKIIQNKMQIPVFCVGSYINYAKCFYENHEIKELKKKYGKTLLVFPTHSTGASVVNFDVDSYFEAIVKEAKDFNSVLLNVFWWNINDPLIRRFESEGFKVISCGFRNERTFLSRLKAFLQIADLVIGDSIGTHVGYCLAMGIPFRYMKGGTTLKIKLEKENKDIDFLEMHQNKIAEAFLNATEITDKQREIVDYYWGNNLFKTEEEIKAIVEINREITDMTYGFTDFRCSAAKKLLKKYADTDEVKYRLLKDAL